MAGAERAIHTEATDIYMMYRDVFLVALRAAIVSSIRAERLQIMCSLLWISIRFAVVNSVIQEDVRHRWSTRSRSSVGILTLVVA